MSEIRNSEQATVVDLYVEKNLLKATMVLSTGFGKSKVALDIIDRLKPQKILIIVNSTILRDYSWKDEFYKFGYGELYENTVETVTYQLAYKWDPIVNNLDHYFVICDEIDFAGGTDELARFFYNYPKVQMLGLTGFITDGKKPWFSIHMPVIVELLASDAQEKDMLNNIHIVFVKYDLSQVRSKTVSYKQHGVDKIFKQSENDAYDYANKKCHILQGDLDKLEKSFEAGEIFMDEYVKKEKNLVYLKRKAEQTRSDLLYLSDATANTAKKLTSYVLAQNPKSKIIVFSARTEQSAKICGEYVYNGSIDKEVALENFQKFQSGEFNLLGVVDKINRGANIPGLNVGIMESYNSSDTKFTQRMGRLMRLDANDTATMYVLLPYYMRKEQNKTYTVQETQQVKWAVGMMRSTIVKTHEVWDYRTVKSN